MEGSEPVAVSCGEEEAWKEEQGEVMEEKEEGGLAVKWERFLSRKSLRVLLVESDDSTRQIIAALLRKCSYKVAAVADGLKAWETLKENSFNIDLVLTEVELPTVSGFSLLTMIMEHDTFKNIPVIMMSSHDSINMVFKCMLKGAADFLVKPIRKNELRNMWQHVWRRHSFNVEPDSENGYQGEMLAEQKFKGNSEKNSDGNHSIDFVACAQNTRESSEKGSDAQSSCTRPDMEGDSVYMQSVQDLKETNYRSVSLMNETRVQEGEECIESDEVVPMHDNETEDCMKDTNITCDSKDQNFDQANSFGEVIDLIGAIDNHSNCSYGLHKNGAAQAEFPGDAKNHVDAQDQKGMSSTMLMLELSLRRCQPSSYTQDNDKSNMLNHSNSSAFSWYNNRMVPAPIAISTNFRSESKDCFSWSQKSPPIQGPFHTNTASQCSGVMQNMNMEDTNSPYIGHSTPEGTADQCSRLDVIPFPVPIGGMTYNNLCARYGSEPRFPVPTNPTIEEAVHLNLSHHSEPEAINSGLSHNPHDQSSKGQIYQAKQHQVQNLESVEDQRRISSITGQSGSSSNGDISRSHLNSSGCESVCNGSNANLTATNVVQTTADSGNTVLFVCDRNNPTDYHCSNQREAALTKFRLKRKDRCFEKKVRYQSRKRLAEQRPRVKGQFVRQVQTDHQSTEDDR